MTIQIEQPNDRKIVINGQELTYEQKVTQALVVGERVIVVLKSYDFRDDDPDGGRNVFAYDNNGKLLWQIENPGFTARGKRGQDVPQGYMGVSPRKNGMLMAFQPSGFECMIDQETGKFLSEKFVK